METPLRIFIFGLGLMSSPLFAEMNVIQWMDKKLDGKMGATIPGSTLEDKQPCGLHLSRQIDKVHYLVVSPTNEPRTNEDYVGVIVEEARVRSTGRLHILETTEAWGNKSSRNRITLEFNSSGDPDRVTGESDLKKLTCVFNSPSS